MKRLALLLALPLFAQEPEGNIASKSAKTTGALSATEYGKEGMIGSGVAITLDDKGTVYVLQTYRRNNAEIDIRKNKDWLLDSLALTSPEDRQALIKKRMPDTWQSLAKFKEKVIKLEDTDGDGRADKRSIVFEGLNELGSGLAAGILWHDGALYVTCMPSLWKLTDKDGDGIFETKQELVRGIGYHIGYGGHDMHGPTLGPDGRIYWTTGDKGIHVKPKDGPEVHLPGQGGCFRIEPDGSHFEVFAHGLRNSEDLAFDEFGNLFTVDNDGDFGDKERAINVVEGADYGWRMHYQYRSDRSWGQTAGYNPWLADNLWKPFESGQYQPAYLTPALANFSVGPIGFDYNPGTALSDKWKNTFFLAESSKDIQAFRFEPQGAGFKMLETQAVVTGPFITGISFGPDGALYAADWGENAWAPHEKGRVLKLDATDAVNDSVRAEVKRLIGEGMSKRGIEELKTLLGHADQRVRVKAQFELVKRGDEATLRTVAERGAPLMARIHAVWGLGQLARVSHSGANLAGLLEDKESEIRAQAARMLSDANVPADLSKLLADASPRVREYAGMALRKLGTSAQVEAVTKMLEQNNDADLFLRHAGAMALAGCAREGLAKIAAHGSKAVRIAAVIAARLNASPDAAAFLNDGETSIVGEAARAIHDDNSIPEALPALAKLLDKPGLTDEATLRRIISANIRVGDAECAQRLMTYALNTKAPKAMRAEALETLVLWPTGLGYDRVQAMHRQLPARDAAPVRAEFTKVFDTLIADPLPEVQAATAKLVSALNDKVAIQKLTPIALDESASLTMRSTALQTIALAKAPKAKDAINKALKSETPLVRVAALRALTVYAPDDKGTFTAINDALKRNIIEEQQAVFALLPELKNKEAENLISNWADLAAKGKVAKELMLDVYEATNIRGKSLKKKLSAIDAKLKKDKVKYSAWGLALNGGNATEGKAIFGGSTTAACMQCHTLTAGIPSVGPDLSKVATRLTPEHLLQAVIDPQSEIAEGYGLVSATLKNGSVQSGLLAKESEEELTLRIPATPITIPVKKADIASRTKPASAMPVMTSLLTKMEVRDLVAYLQTLR